jgi:hypothetical protein
MHPSESPSRGRDLHDGHAAMAWDQSFLRALTGTSKSPKVTILDLTRNTTSRTSRSVPARDSRRYNFDSPVFVGRDGVVLKRKAPAQDAHMQPHRGHPNRPPHHTVPATGQYSASNSIYVQPTWGTAGPASEVPTEDVKNDLTYASPSRLDSSSLKLTSTRAPATSGWVWSGELRVNTAGHARVCLLQLIYSVHGSPPRPFPRTLAPPSLSGAMWNISYGDGSGVIVSNCFLFLAEPST